MLVQRRQFGLKTPKISAIAKPARHRTCFSGEPIFK